MVGAVLAIVTPSFSFADGLRNRSDESATIVWPPGREGAFHSSAAFFFWPAAGAGLVEKRATQAAVIASIGLMMHFTSRLTGVEESGLGSVLGVEDNATL